MSSDESTDREGQAKKRRVQRACDVCRRKKIRCDGAQMADHKCSNCISYNFECTYNEAARKRGPPKGYVELLENRLEKMEGLLQKLCPDGDFTQELGGRFDKETWLKTKGAAASVPAASSSKSTFSPSGSGSAQSPRSPSEEDDFPSSDDDVPEGLTLSTWLQELQINPATPRFFGKSSGARLVKSAMALKSDLTGVEPRPASVLMQDLRTRRPEYWHIHPWEQKELSADADRLQRYNFPDSDLLPQLVDRYFTEINIILPVLHRPTFERSIAEGLHLKDDGFASVLLVVCSAGARYVDDPRVFLEGASTHSAGWKWFNQVQMVRKSLLAPPRLYDIQLYCLATMFLQGSSAPQACWSIVGIGIRLAQDIGAHRRKMYAAKPSVHDELWKRAFWVLVAFDRGISSGLGRPCAIQDEDFDVDLPLMVDDEYWENEAEPEKAFQQPEGKPSKIAAFVCLVKLNQILAFALRTIYSINKSKVLLGFVGPQWEQNIVSELDSALNKWIDSIPDHLRWDPKREDTDFFHQSATLYVAYYQLQIAIHRPFIPNRNRQGTMALPALAICTNAARSSSHVMDIHQTRRNAPLPIHMPASFTAGIVLLLSIWGGKRGGVILDPAKEMADVYRCMNILKRCEGRWHIAGRFWDILWELASVSDLPLPEYNPGPALKRDREEEVEVQQGQAQASVTSQVPPPQPGGYAARSIAGNRRVYGNQADLAPQAFPASSANSAGPSNVYSTSFPLAASTYQYQGPPSDAHYYQPPLAQEQQWLPPDLGNAPQTYDPIPDPSTYSNLSPGSTFPVNFEQPGMQQSWWPQDTSFGSFDQMFSGMYGSPPTTDTASTGVYDQFNMPQGMYQPRDPVLEAQAGYVNPGTEGTFSTEALSLWADAPGTFVSDDWSSFIMGMSDPSMSVPGPIPGPTHTTNMPGTGQASYGQYRHQ